MKYRKLIKHKRKPKKETDAFSKNTEKVVYTYGDGGYRTQSHLSGKYQDYNKKGKPIRTKKIKAFKVDILLSMKLING